MPRKTFQSDKAPGGLAPLSTLTVHNGLIFLSGLTAADPNTGELDGDAAQQTGKALSIIENVLADYGSNMNNVLRCTIYLRDLKDFASVNEVYARCFSEPYPARTCIEVAKLPLGALIEIDVIAAE